MATVGEEWTVGAAFTRELGRSDMDFDGRSKPYLAFLSFFLFCIRARTCGQFYARAAAAEMRN